MSEFYQLDHDAQARAMRQLAESALVHWGLPHSELELIKYRENAVFRVDAADGARYALRIHRHGYHSDEALRSELGWMQALQAAGIPVPELVTDREGQPFRTVRAASVPEPRQVDLFRWLDGRQLGSVERGVDNTGSIATVYRTVGELMARVHEQAVDWSPPRGFRRHAWDADALVGEEPLWGRFWELPSLSHDQRALLQAARHRLRQDLARYGADPANRGRYSLIHADFVVENLMVNGDEVRLIDFDDAGYGWHLFDLATALHFELEEAYYPQAFEALVEGYRRHRELPDSQLAHMPMFYLARSTTYLGWVHTRSETETARELTPMLVEKCCGLARDYLAT
jgi:Ser/Thr protein kinase RdoA (MazF antagonist)